MAIGTGRSYTGEGAEAVEYFVAMILLAADERLPGTLQVRLGGSNSVKARVLVHRLPSVGLVSNSVSVDDRVGTLISNFCRLC